MPDKVTTPDLMSYARAFTVAHADVPVSSPWTAWSLLAAVGVFDAGGQDRLGSLLDGLPDDVACACAAWSRDVGTLTQWGAGLPAYVTHGPLPDQAGADTWARRHTGGLIERFPLAVGDPRMMAVLASALAVRTQWADWLGLEVGARLGGDFAGQVERCLLVPDARIYDTPSAGRVVAATMRGDNGVRVVSVLADAGIAAGDVHAAAYDIVGGGAREVAASGLEDGDHGLFTVRTAMGYDDGGRSYVPAWRASVDDLDLTADPGFETVRDLVAAQLEPEMRPQARITAKQASVARFDRAGFEAASVTAAGVMVTSAPLECERKEVHAGFGRPYAVLATCEAAGETVPLCSVWVTEPSEEIGPER